VDTTAPTVTSSVFDLSGSRMGINIGFSETLQQPISGNALQLTNLGNNSVVPASSIHVDFNPATNLAHFTFPGYPNGVLPDGNYRAVLRSGTVTDLSGNSLASDNVLSFYVLAGDINRDRWVDNNDLIQIAANFNKPVSGNAYFKGDFNYDGVVDNNDLILVVPNFGKFLAPPTQPALRQSHTVALAEVSGALSTAIASLPPDAIASGGSSGAPEVVAAVNQRCQWFPRTR